MKEGYIYNNNNNNNFVTMHALIQYSVDLEILNITFQKKKILNINIYFLKYSQQFLFWQLVRKHKKEGEM